LRIGIVQARFNEQLTGQLAQVCIDELLALGVVRKHIQHVTVPGGLEVSVAFHAMADSQRYAALIPLGCLTRGRAYHIELVANESGAAVTRVSLDHHIPIANAILTVENEAQAIARVEEKGRDAARVAVEMANLLDDLL